MHFSKVFLACGWQWMENGGGSWCCVSTHSILWNGTPEEAAYLANSISQENPLLRWTLDYVPVYQPNKRPPHVFHSDRPVEPLRCVVPFEPPPPPPERADPDEMQ